MNRRERRGGIAERMKMKINSTDFQKPQVEAAWRLLMPVLEAWKASPPSDFSNYADGTWGPDEGKF
jgi:glucose-6-phosphate 1-dehydrogenase